MSTSATCASRASTVLMVCRTVSSRSRAADRSPASHSSTVANRPTSNSVRSSRPRSSGSARRNRAKSPCGSSTTWQNCSADSPSRVRRYSDPSSMRVLTGAQSVAGPALHGQLGLLGGPALTTLLGPLLLGAADDPQPLGAEGHLAGDLGADVGAGMVAAEPLLLAAGTGDRAVEGEHDGVEQGGLARAGGAPQQEQAVAAGLVEVDPHRLGERTERGQRERVQPHASTSARAAAASARPSRSRSAGVAGTARTRLTNSPTTSRSLRPRSTLLIAAPVGRRRRTGPLEVDAVREAGLQPAHRVGGPHRVGEPRGDEVLLDRGVRRVGQQVGQRRR